MDFDTWIDDAWNRHADAPAAVLAELATAGAGLAADDAAVGRLMQRAQHRAGAHQGGPAELAAGRALQATLAALPAAGGAAPEGQAHLGRLQHQQARGVVEFGPLLERGGDVVAGHGQRAHGGVG
ncbi:MAG: hypothetical protein ACK57B_06325, partial [Betaproteobacteria bacterium]